MVGQLVGGVDGAGAGPVRLLLLSVLTTAGMLAAPLATEPWVVAALLFVTGTGFMGWNVVTVSLRQRIVPERLLGRLNASYRLVAWGTMPIGAALGGVLAEVFGLRSVFAVTAAHRAAASCSSCRSSRTPSSRRRRPRRSRTIRTPTPPMGRPVTTP